MSFYDNLGLSGKKELDRQKRLDEAKVASLLDSQKEKEDKSLQESIADRYAMSNQYAMPNSRKKDRINKLNEEVSYMVNAPVVAMTEMVSQVVEKSLLLDEAELASVYPNYREDIREIVGGFLKNSNANNSVKNPDTLELMEYVSKTLPSVKDGKYLTEDELASLYNATQIKNVDKAIDNLSGDVSSRVANLMEKEQERVQKIDKEIAKAKGEEELPADEKIEPQDEELANEEVEEAPEEAADENVNEVPEEVEETSVEGTPKKQVQMLPDGTMNINVYETKFVKETPRSGLIESIAVNEAMQQLKEGKEYNADYCLAKALVYLTITETLKASELVNLTDNDYAQVVVAAGGQNISECKTVKMTRKTPVTTGKSDLIHRPHVKPTSMNNLQEAVMTMGVMGNPLSNDAADFAERIRQRKLARTNGSVENLSE